MTDTTQMPYRLPRRIGIADAVRTCLRKYATFSGRAPRAEFWKFVLAYILAQIVLIVVNTLLFGPSENFLIMPNGDEVLVGVTYSSGWPGTILSLLAFIPMLAVGWRRLHDVDRPGWWVIVPPIVQVVLLLTVFRAVFGLTPATGAPVSGGLVMLVVLAIFAIWITLIVFLARRGTPGPNRFGPNPLEVTQ